MHIQIDVKISATHSIWGNTLNETWLYYWFLALTMLKKKGELQQGFTAEAKMLKSLFPLSVRQFIKHLRNIEKLTCRNKQVTAAWVDKEISWEDLTVSVWNSNSRQVSITVSIAAVCAIRTKRELQLKNIRYSLLSVSIC